MNYFKHLTLGLAFFSLLFSCQKSENSSEEIDDKPAQVIFGSNLRSNILATKAGVDNWNQQKLYVYAFPTGKIPADEDSILIKNIEAAAPASGEKGSIEIKKDGKFFYYSADKRTYDFFAYYVDGAAGATPSPTITPGSDVTLPITIDGSYDVMLATTDKQADIDSAHASIAPTDAYSAYSARKNVVPNLIFKHQLSRFVFRIVAGSTEAKSIRIDSITLRSCSKGDLVIAPEEESGIFNPKDSLDLVLKATTGKISDFVPKYKGGHPSFDEKDRVGESIMVIPSDVHHMEIHMVQYKDSTKGETVGTITYIYNLTTKMIETTVPHPDNKFLTGYRYNVNVVVYGLKKVEVKVTLSPWDDGGTITIDNEKEWGDEPKYGIKAWNADSTASPYLYFYGDIAVGTPVKVWDKSLNSMIFATPDTYTFVKDTMAIHKVTLKKDPGSDTTRVDSTSPSF